MARPEESIVIHPGARVWLRCALRAPAVGQWLKVRQCTAKGHAVLIPCTGSPEQDTESAVIIALRYTGGVPEAEVVFQVGLITERHIEMVRDPMPDDILPGPDTRDQDVMSAVHLLIGDPRRAHTLMQSPLNKGTRKMVIPGLPRVKIETTVDAGPDIMGSMVLRIDHHPPENVPTSDVRQLMTRALEALMEAIERLPPDPVPDSLRGGI